jgi:hypothetical protein
MAELKSEGKCVFCEKMYSKRGIGRHLGTHLKSLEKEAKTTKKAYHLMVPAAEMFLHLLVDGATTFGKLDNFLREIWLECCGHLSSFEVQGKRYNNDWDSLEYGEKSNKKVGQVFRKGMKLDYKYDFGSTTYLEIKVVEEYNVKAKGGILLLSRNEPLPILCHVCEEHPAIEICAVCIYSGSCVFCEKCAKKHAKSCSDFGDNANMPIVNSPRMGVCGYDGGVIDVERDGRYRGSK